MLNETETKIFLEKHNWISYSNRLKAQHLDLIEYLNSKYPHKRISEQLWLYVNNHNSPPTCLVCDKPSRFKNIKLGYSDFCGSKTCFSQYRKANSKSAAAIANQSVNPPQCKHPQCEKPVKKNSQGLWRSYCSFECRGQHNSLKSRDKARKTWTEKYGVDHPRKSSEVNEKLKQKWMDAHGVDNPAKLDWVQEKMRATCLEKYGRENGGHMNHHQQNENLYLLKDKTELQKLYPSNSPCDIAEIVGCHIYTVYEHLRMHGLTSYGKSSFEKEVVNFLEDLGVENIVENDRKILNGKELDIVLPDYNMAIECNGLYWHTEKYKEGKEYHRQKFLECEQAGIQLLSIFNDAWDDKKEIVKSIIRHKIGKSGRRIFARKCTLKRVNNRDLKQFLNSNHIQGFVGASYAYALFYHQEIVAVMTFSSPRSGIGKNIENCYEIVRYASSVPVVGGASKLLSNFTRDHSPSVIVSYSDNEWSTGDLYLKLGFELDRELPASYSYLAPGGRKMYHRYRFAKHQLVKEGFDPSKTEKQIMQERNFLRVWNCGKRTWKLTL